MNEDLENLYFEWLYFQVVKNEHPTPSNSYYKLMKILHTTEFVWLVNGDDNRAIDGKDLRSEFLILADIPDDLEWRSINCSFLEMLIAFSRRVEFATDEPAINWFWMFLENIELSRYNDASHIQYHLIEDILDTLIWRTYKPDGNGGMFPLNNPKNDERHIEIWYQFCHYYDELEGSR